MRRMGERRATKSPWPGLFLGVLIVVGVSVLVIHRQNSLIGAALGKTKKQAEKEVVRVVEDDHPNAEERNFLKLLISQVGGE